MKTQVENMVDELLAFVDDKHKDKVNVLLNQIAIISYKAGVDVTAKAFSDEIKRQSEEWSKKYNKPSESKDVK